MMQVKVTLHLGGRRQDVAGGVENETGQKGFLAGRLERRGQVETEFLLSGVVSENVEPRIEKLAVLLAVFQPIGADDWHAETDGAEEFDGAPDAIRHQYGSVFGIVDNLSAYYNNNSNQHMKIIIRNLDDGRRSYPICGLWIDLVRRRNQ